MIAFLDFISGFIVILILIAAAHNHFARKRPIITKENGYMFGSYSDNNYSFNLDFNSDFDNDWFSNNHNDDSYNFNYTTGLAMDPSETFSSANISQFFDNDN